MKQIRSLIIIVIIACVAGISCTKNERMIYSELEKIYFSQYNSTMDSLNYSLIASPEVDTVKLSVKLLGNKLTESKKFKLSVIGSLTDAVEGTHYKTLEEFYEFPVGQFIYELPIIVYKTDESLNEKTVTLAVKLEDTGDLKTAYEDRIKVRIILSNMFSPPVGDGYYGNMTQFIKLFGEYSRVKHQKIIELAGHDFQADPLNQYGNNPFYKENFHLYFDYSYYVPFARILYQYFKENEVLDENGNIIGLWDVP